MLKHKQPPRIPDPFVDMNELAVRWVADNSWTYKSSFPNPKDLAPGSRTDLVFEGLDTFATVTLNGHTILEADNMFLEYRVDVTSHLRDSSSDVGPENVLEMVFAPALHRGRELVKQHEHEHDFIAHQTENSRLPVRKAQCHWGWDWGPILTTAGPWRPVFLESYRVRIDDVWWLGQVSEDLKTVEGKLYARVDGAQQARHETGKVKFELLLGEKALFQPQECHIDQDGTATTDFTLGNPALWYPHGYGEQPLYTLKATFSPADDSAASTPKIKTTGFRRCELIQEPDQYGKSFYFRINGIDVFCGGSNWIPADSLLPRISESEYRKWMELMVEGGQIMTRYVRPLVFPPTPSRPCVPTHSTP
jgi:beta-mannosidase